MLASSGEATHHMAGCAQCRGGADRMVEALREGPTAYAVLH